MKKILSIVLALSLVLGSFGFAFAAPSDVAGTDYEDAVARLMALGIVNGYEDGTYKPGKAVTRAEMAKLVVVALGLEDVAEFAGNMTVFSDMEGHWANKYVNVAQSEGILKGFPDGTFRPDEEVTYPQAITIIVRALGYEDDKLSGTWPLNFIAKADKLGLTDDITVKSSGANRGDVALMLDAALTTEMVSYDADGNEEKGDKLVANIATLVENVIVKEVNEDSIVDQNDDEIDTLIDMSKYLFADINVYTNENDEIVFVDAVNSEVAEGTASIANDVLTVLDDDDEQVSDYTFPLTGVKVNLNGVTTTYAKAEASLADAEVKVVYTLNEDEDAVDTVLGVIATEDVSYHIVTTDYDAEEVEEDDFVFDGYTLPTTENDDEETILDVDNVIVTGDVNKLEDIQEDDVIYVYTGTNEDDEVEKVKIVVVRDTVKGEVTKTKSDANGLVSITLDGKTYDVADESLTVTAGADYTLILDKDGEVVKAVKVDDDSVEGYITEVKNYTTVKDGETVDMTKVTILTVDGEETYKYEDEEYDGNTISEEVFGEIVLDKDGMIKDFTELSGTGTVATIAEDMIDEDDMTIEVTAGTYLVNSDTVIFDMVNEEFLTFEDIKEGMEIKYTLDGYVYEYIFVTAQPALDDVTGIFVESYSEADEDGTKYYVVLNVEGEELTYETESALTVAESVYLVDLTDSTGTGEEGTFDAIAEASGLVNVTVTAVNDDEITTDGQDYLVTSTTVIYVIDEDDDVTIGKVNDIKKDMSIQVVGSGSMLGTFEKADYIVIKK